MKDRDKIRKQKGGNQRKKNNAGLQRTLQIKYD
jgi:hypothetical protein